MDTLCRICIEKAEKWTSLSSKIEESSNLSLFDFLNKCTTLNAREGDKLPQCICSVCDNAMKMFYSFMKRAEKSDLILREGLKKLVAEGGHNGCKETPCEESAKRKKISPRKNSTRSSLYILDFVKEEPCISEESTSIVAVKKAVINESEDFESNLNHPEKSNEEPDDVSSHRHRRITGIDTSELTVSENGVPTSALKRILAKSKDEANSQRNSCEGIRKETIEAEESEDFNQGDSFHCQPSKNSTGSFPYVLDIVKEEPRVSESTSIVAVKDAVINESENSESNLDHPKEKAEKFVDILSCKISSPSSSDAEQTDSEDDVPIGLLEKRLAKNGNETDSQRNSSKGKTRKKMIAHECETCGKKFLKKHNLKNHLKTHKKKRLKCEKCDQEFEHIKKLHRHMDSHADPLKPEQCKQCGKILKHRQSLLRHMQLHTNPNRYPFKCEHCKESFAKESSCQNHPCYKRVYKKKKRFECEICGKHFSKDYLNNVHMKSHKGIKIKCNQCGKEFMHRDSLSRHMKWHDNPDASKCEICDKSLSSKESYARHMELCHLELSENSKINCEKCDKSFSTKYYLDLHMEIHNGITRKCDKCGQEFKHKDSLSRHMKWHNNPTPFKCEKCEGLFDRKYKYNSHIKICIHAGKQQQLKTE